MPAALKIATRQSKLALWQAEHVADLLRRAHPGLQVELVRMTTQGDRIQDRSLADIGGKGLFIKELEVALEEGRADIAVHSMKDVPVHMPPGMIIGAVLVRADTSDAFCATRYAHFEDLPQGARVGTSSPRRQAQLLARRPDLNIEALRGNVDTRLRRLDAGELDAIVLASAGLIRLGWASRITARFPTALCLPAVGQGAIGVECREAATDTLRLIAALDHASTHQALRAEREFARHLGGDCYSPIAALAQIDGTQERRHGGRMHITGLVAAPDGSRVIRDAIEGDGNSAFDAASARMLGVTLAERLIAGGADRLLEQLRA